MKPAVLFILLLAFAVITKSQTRDSLLYKISAEAGPVNYVEGEVTVSNELDIRSLVKGDKVLIGDKVRTAANAKAEILLNPGSYIRLAENSEFEFLNTSLDDLQLRLNKGTAILEIFATKDFKVSVLTPKAEVSLTKTGVYRFDINDSGEGTLKVWKGIAQVGHLKIAKRQKAVLSDQVMVAKFSHDGKDQIERWSKDRSKYLAKLNSQLERKTLRDSLIASHNSWSFYDSFGLWVFTPRFGVYCFLPFGYGWQNPYGFWFVYDIWSIPLPAYIFYPRTSSLRPAISGKANVPATVPRNASGGTEKPNPVETPPIVPPFMKIQKDVGITREIPTRIDSKIEMPIPVLIQKPSANPIPTTVPSAPDITPSIIVPPSRKRDN